MWALGALMHLMFSMEEPWANNKSINSIMDIICLSKQGIPYLKVPNFPISNKIKNVDLRILIRNCLERNQIKRIDLENLEERISNFITKLLLHDLNFDVYENLHYRRGTNII